MSSSQRFRFLCVIDFEATCDDYNVNHGDQLQEIIEFPAVLLDTEVLKVVDTFQVFIKPEVEPILTDFCKNLTGITQDQIDNGINLLDAMKRFDDWLHVTHSVISTGLERNFAIATDGPWDIKNMLFNDCKRKNILDYFHDVKYYSEWVNVRRMYKSEYGRAGGITSQLQGLNMTFEGKEHCGLDDAKNIARIVIKMITDGKVFKLNDRLRGKKKEK
ncbi:exoribonuclease [Acrasis kona]|uniref:Exoribonuclease n=1 Tax=Acrasis kona TaxID=1008807 RepID=A0AAW2ZC89_9EUKA